MPAECIEVVIVVFAARETCRTKVVNTKNGKPILFGDLQRLVELLRHGNAASGGCPFNVLSQLVPTNRI